MAINVFWWIASSCDHESRWNSIVFRLLVGGVDFMTSLLRIEPTNHTIPIKEMKCKVNARHRLENIIEFVIFNQFTTVDHSHVKCGGISKQRIFCSTFSNYVCAEKCLPSEHDK